VSYTSTLYGAGGIGFGMRRVAGTTAVGYFDSLEIIGPSA
jgi:hypothetical protein